MRPVCASLHELDTEVTFSLPAKVLDAKRINALRRQAELKPQEDAESESDTCIRQRPRTHLIPRLNLGTTSRNETLILARCISA
ncbi:hypothetical protein ASF30_05180 [Leifsonia sp. Leaf264]|nr:hypothetical protein ASF30_05180 [Leifsonia sp. Leaf264]